MRRTRTWAWLLAAVLLAVAPAAMAQPGSATSTTGETGLFTLFTAETLPQGEWSFGLYYNNWDRVLDLDGIDVDEESVDWNRLSASLGYGITDRWEVLANAGYLDTELRTQNAANNSKRLTLSPAFSTSVWTTYRLPLGLNLGGGVRYTDSVWINTANTIQSPGYHVVDALAEYPLNSHLSLRWSAAASRYAGFA